MARTFPPQLVYRPQAAGAALLGQSGTMATVYTDEALTTLAGGALTADGAPTVSSRVLLDAASRTPRLGGLSDVVTSLWIKPDGSTVATEIFADPEEVIAALAAAAVTGKQRNLDFVPGTYAKALAAATVGTPTRCKFVSLGDSVASKKFDAIYTEFVRAWGGRAGVGGTGPSASVTRNTSTGTVTDPEDFGLWYAGSYSRLATGATATYGAGGGSVISDRIYVPLFRAPGVTTIQIDGVDAPGFTNIDTSGIGDQAGDLVMYTLTTTRAAHTVKLVNVSGVTDHELPLFEDTTVTGLMPINLSRSGLGLNQASAQAWRNLGRYLNAIDPTVVTLESKEQSSYFATALASLLTAVQAISPEPDFVGIGSTPIGSNDADQVLQNAQLLAAVGSHRAAGFNAYYWDGYTPVAPYSYLTELGWQGDGTHIALTGDYALGKDMAADLGWLPGPDGRTGGDNRSNTQIVDGKLVFGADEALPNGQIEPSGGDDLKVTVGRHIEFFNRTGGALTRLLGTTPFLQSFFHFGSGATAGIGSPTGTTRVIAATASNFGTLVSIEAAAYALKSASNAAAAGSVSLDLKDGLHLLTLTGNVTALSFTNANPNSEEIEVHFTQDGTGGRTVTGVSGQIQLAGGGTSLTLTATAGKTDIYRFRKVATNVYRETSRSLNV